MTSIAIGRLTEERKKWRKDHPAGFYAKPMKNGDEIWETGIPGKENTDWEGGMYKVIMEFSIHYPAKPPRCKFDPPIFHPNVFRSGEICLSLLNEDQDWRPNVSVKELLLAIQNLLSSPNNSDPAQHEAHEIFRSNKAEYSRRIRAQARRHVPDL